MVNLTSLQNHPNAQSVSEGKGPKNPARFDLKLVTGGTILLVGLALGLYNWVQKKRNEDKSKTPLASQKDHGSLDEKNKKKKKSKKGLFRFLKKFFFCF